MKVPVQSGFTVYVPVTLNWRMLPFRLAVAVYVAVPFPSKFCVPTSTHGPNAAGGAGGVMNPVDVNAKVPLRLALEHPLSLALAVGAMPRASAVTAAIVKVFAMVLRFMILFFAFISCLHSGRRSMR